MKMKYLILVLYLVSLVLSNPVMIQVPDLQQLTPQTQDASLQELQALQMLQAMQRISNPQPLSLNLPPVAQFYVAPRQPIIGNLFEKSDIKKDTQLNTKDNEKGDFDSVIIDAATNTNDIGTQNQKLLLVLSSPMAKQERFAIGSIISTIPFLPIEINVIDAATWIYNNIANIIGSLRPPFGQSQAQTQQQTNKGIILNALMKGKDGTVPMMALPVNVNMIPFQNVAQYRPMMLPLQV